MAAKRWMSLFSAESAHAVPRSAWASASKGAIQVLSRSTLSGLYRYGPRGRRAMKSSLSVTVSLKLNVAWCLFGIAAIITALN